MSALVYIQSQCKRCKDHHLSLLEWKYYYERKVGINLDLVPVILLHEKSGRTFCPKTRKTFRTFSENLGQNSCQSNFHSTGC